jgi:excisionase family DNA binding protein
MVELTIPIPTSTLAAIARVAAELVQEQLEDIPDYLDTASVAAYLRWPKKRIDNLCAKGEIPFYKHGNRRVFIRQEIDEWVQNG